MVLISGISLVGAIVIFNIMFVSVVERTKEAWCAAPSARQRDIRRQFLIEAALLQPSA
jgi:ABC-type antimicrobial peptide transport system permease subunit